MAGVMASTPTVCTCGSVKVELYSHKAKEYSFVEVRCKTCGARSSLGQYKNGGMFWKEFAKYEGEAAQK